MDTRRLIGSALFFLALVGCGEESSAEVSYGSFVAQRAAQAATAEESCDCFAVGGMFSSREQCLAASVPAELTREQKSCLTAVFDTSSAGLDPTYVCQTEAFNALASCISQIAGCDSAGFTSCGSAFQASITACPAADVAAQAAVEDCVPPMTPPSP